MKERWTITFDSEGRPRAVGEHADARAFRNGWSTIEVVPALQLREVEETARVACRQAIELDKENEALEAKLREAREFIARMAKLEHINAADSIVNAIGRDAREFLAGGQER